MTENIYRGVSWVDDMDIHLSKETAKKIQKISKRLGVGQNDVIDRAISLYLDSISKQMDFRRELKQWDILSDEALLSFDEEV